MQIDWFTVVAQILNFLALVWLLKRFLYKPILAAIDAREQLIASTLQKATDTQEEANNEREKYQASLAEFETQRSTKLQVAIEEAHQEAQKLLTEARAAADHLTEKRKLDQHRELQQLREEIQQLTIAEVFALTRKILTGLANSTLEDSMLTMFTEQLQQMSKDSQALMITALKELPIGGVVNSSHPLDAALQQRLQVAINALAGIAVPLQFVTKPALVCGVELQAKGQKIAWNVAANLELLEARLTIHLDTSAADSAPGPTHE